MLEGRLPVICLMVRDVSFVNFPISEERVQNQLPS